MFNCLIAKTLIFFTSRVIGHIISFRDMDYTFLFCTKTHYTYYLYITVLRTGPCLFIGSCTDYLGISFYLPSTVLNEVTVRGDD